MSNNLKTGPVPPTLKPIAHFLKTASEHESRDPVVTYWCRLAALQVGMKLDKASKEALAVLLPIMDWMEKEKKVLAENEAISSEVVAAAHIENYALKLFSWADKEDRASHFNKNVVKAFYSAGMLFDCMEAVFGELTPENAHARKYAKWKAAYIHNCLKNGETPVPGPAASGEEDDEAAAVTATEPGASGGWQAPLGGDPALQPMIPPTSSATAPDPAPVPTPRATVPTPQQPQYVAPVPVVATVTAPQPGGYVTLSAAQVTKTQKYCKYASSALDYDDRITAIDNLTKALRLLQTGQE